MNNNSILYRAITIPVLSDGYVVLYRIVHGSEFSSYVSWNMYHRRIQSNNFCFQIFLCSIYHQYDRFYISLHWYTTRNLDPTYVRTVQLRTTRVLKFVKSKFDLSITARYRTYCTLFYYVKSICSMTFNVQTCVVFQNPYVW